MDTVDFVKKSMPPTTDATAHCKEVSICVILFSGLCKCATSQANDYHAVTYLSQ